MLDSISPVPKQNFDVLIHLISINTTAANFTILAILLVGLQALCLYKVYIGIRPRHWLKDGDELIECFDARVKPHLTATHCDTSVASPSMERLTKCVTTAAQETLRVKQHQTLRKQPYKATV